MRILLTRGVLAASLLLGAGLSACRATPTSPDESQLEGPDEFRAVIGDRTFETDRLRADARLGGAIEVVASNAPGGPVFLEQLSIAAQTWTLGVPSRISAVFYARQDAEQPPALYLIDSLSPGTITVIGLDPFRGRLTAEFESRVRLYVLAETGQFAATDSIVSIRSGFVRYNPRFEF